MKPALGLMLTCVAVFVTSCQASSGSQPPLEATNHGSNNSVGSRQPGTSGHEWWTAERRVAADITYRSDGLRETAPLDIVLQAAPLAFTGEVESLDGPFWNAADGQRWFPGESVDGFTTVPYLYGVANVVVRRVLFDDTGTLSEDRVLPLYVVSDDLSLSGLETGTSVLILGTFEVFPFREGPVDVYRPILGGYSILVQTPADSDRYLPVLAEEGYPIAGDPILTRYPSGPTVDELAAVIDEYKSAERPPEGAWGGLYLITLSSDLLGPGVEPPLGAPDE